MTRNSDLDCEDLFGCTHEAETPVVDHGEIIYWLCRCGRRAESESEDASELHKESEAASHDER